MYVLVVDDEEVTRAGLIRLVGSMGHTTCWAATGEGALRTMRVEKPDVVILDMLLGRGMSGWDVAREKLLDPDIRHIPVIVVSGLDSGTVRERAMIVSNALSGAMLILSKPVETEVLARALESIEEGKK